jgi:4-hydroxy-tetrahydrodipicolinate reductase
MTRVLVTGAAGRMGDHVLRAVAADPQLELGSALEVAGHPRLGEELAPGIALTDDARAACERADVAIDFSLPKGTLELLEAALPRALPLVIATTGFSDSELERLREAGARVPIVRASNFSLGINVMLELVARAVQSLPGYDIEVLELHHGLKRDAPSGTALWIAEAAAAARGDRLEDRAVYHREGETGPRTPGSIGMQSLRAGDSVGEHTLYLAGRGERLEISHRALSRDNFAAGALRAARWLIGKPPGLYSMREVMSADGA